MVFDFEEAWVFAGAMKFHDDESQEYDKSSAELWTSKCFAKEKDSVTHADEW